MSRYRDAVQHAAFEQLEPRLLLDANPVQVYVDPGLDVGDGLTQFTVRLVTEGPLHLSTFDIDFDGPLHQVWYQPPFPPGAPLEATPTHDDALVLDPAERAKDSHFLLPSLETPTFIFLEPPEEDNTAGTGSYLSLTGAYGGEPPVSDNIELAQIVLAEGELAKLTGVVAFKGQGEEYEITATIGTPDLELSEVVYTADTYVPNAPFEFEVNITNNGGLVSPGRAISAEVHLSANRVYGDADDYFLGTVTYDQGLDRFDDVWLPVEGTIPEKEKIPEGNYYIVGKVDPENTIEEANEGDNTYAWLEADVEIVHVTPPDFVVTGLTYDAGEYAPGAPFHLSFTLENISDFAFQTGESVNIWAYLSADQTVTVLDHIVAKYTYTGDLAAHGSTLVEVDGEIPQDSPGGNFYVGVVADASRAVVELDETNNTTWSDQPDVVVPARVNLTPTAVSAEAGYYTAGDTLTVDFSVQNSSEKNLESGNGFTIEARLTSDEEVGNEDDILIGTVRYDAGLAAGASVDLTIVGDVPDGAQAGGYYLVVQVDSAEEITEADETDNLYGASGAFTVVYAPDLHVGGVAYTAGRYGPNDTIAMEIVEIHFSTDMRWGNTDDVVVYRVEDYAGGIDRQSSITVSVNVQLDDMPEAAYHVVALIDSDLLTATWRSITSRTISAPGRKPTLSSGPVRPRPRRRSSERPWRTCFSARATRPIRSGWTVSTWTATP